MQSRLSFFLAAAATLIGFQSCKAPKKGGERTYLSSFKPVAPRTTDDAREQIRNYLGVATTADLVVNQDENTVYFTGDDVNTTFELNLANGNLEFTKFPGDFGRSVPHLPSAEEATRIARNFLRSHALLPANPAELKLVHTGGVREQAVVSGQRAGPVVDKLVTLTYGRVLNGTPVIGAGSKIVVHIGDQGEVVGTIHRWRELNGGATKALPATELLTQSEAEQQARQQIRMEFGQVPYEIRSAVKSYYDNNGAYLQPVWAFDVRLSLNRVDKNAAPARYLCVIPMLKDSPEPLNLRAVDPRARDRIKAVKPDTRSPANREGTD